MELRLARLNILSSKARCASIEATTNAWHARWLNGRVSHGVGIFEAQKLFEVVRGPYLTGNTPASSKLITLVRLDNLRTFVRRAARAPAVAKIPRRHEPSRVQPKMLLFCPQLLVGVIALAVLGEVECEPISDHPATDARVLDPALGDDATPAGPRDLETGNRPLGYQRFELIGGDVAAAISDAVLVGRTVCDSSGASMP